MKDRCNECRYKMERHGIIEGEDVYYCDICGIYQTYPLEEEALLAAEKKNCGCGQDPCITFGAEVDCPPATQDVKINARNQKQAFDKFGYGPRNVKEPEDYWKKMAEFWEVSVEKAKEQNCGNCVAYDVSPRMKDCGVGENLGYCWMHNFQCQSARTCKTWAKGGPIKTDKESVEWQKRALGDVEKQAENTEKKPEKDHNCISCGHHSAHLKMGDDRFCYDCYHYAETFNSYKVAPELSSYTVDELVDSIAGPQGSAAYDEMVYDPIAQDRLSAESISIPHTVLLLGSIVAGLGFGVFLTKRLGDKTSDNGGA